MIDLKTEIEDKLKKSKIYTTLEDKLKLVGRAIEKNRGNGKI